MANPEVDSLTEVVQQAMARLKEHGEHFQGISELWKKLESQFGGIWSQRNVRGRVISVNSKY